MTGILLSSMTHYTYLSSGTDFIYCCITAIIRGRRRTVQDHFHTGVVCVTVIRQP
jgi:hypothetical protein